MLNIELKPTSGELGATRQSWRTKSVRDLLAKIVAQDPQASDRTLLEKFVKELREDDGYFLAAAEYAFDNARRALRREQFHQPTATQAALRAKEAANHVDRVARIKSRVVLMSLPMPNGKELGKCTGAECKDFGGWYHRLANRVGPDKLVSDVLSEQELHSIYKMG